MLRRQTAEGPEKSPIMAIAYGYGYDLWLWL